MKKQVLWTKDFICITFCNFFVFLTFYYLLVSLPLYSLQELGSNESEAGLLITIFLISAITIRPIAGKWLEKWGKKNILLASLIIFIIGAALYLIPQSLFGLLVVRFLHGIGFGMATTATGAVVADVIPESRRGEGMGYYALSLNLAVVIGPFLGLNAIGHWSPLTLFLIAIICSSLSLLMGLLISFETSKTQRASKVNLKKIEIFENTAVRISIVAALFAIIYSSILSFVSVYAEELNILSAASYFFIVYAGVMLVSRPFTGKWFDRYGANSIIYPAIVFFAIGMLLLSFSSNIPSFLIAAALIGLGWGSLFPSFQALAVQHAPVQKRGLAMATFLSIFDLGIGIGSFIVGIFVANIGLGSFYFYSSFLILVGIGVYNLIYDRKFLNEQAFKGNQA